VRKTTTTITVDMADRDRLAILQRELGRALNPPRVSVSTNDAIRHLLDQAEQAREAGPDPISGGKSHDVNPAPH
jgi:hypothetical protein